MVDVLPCVVRGLNRCTPHFADTLGLRRSLIHLGDRGQRYLRSFAETRKPSRDRLPPLPRSTPRMLLPRGHQEIKRQESLAAGLPGSRTSGAPMLRQLAASDWQDIPELMEGKKKGGGDYHMPESRWGQGRVGLAVRIEHFPSDQMPGLP